MLAELKAIADWDFDRTENKLQEARKTLVAFLNGGSKIKKSFRERLFWDWMWIDRTVRPLEADINGEHCLFEISCSSLRPENVPIDIKLVNFSEGNNPSITLPVTLKYYERPLEQTA